MIARDGQRPIQNRSMDLTTNPKSLEFGLAIACAQKNRQKENDGYNVSKITIEDILSCPDYWNLTDPMFNDSAAIIREFCRDAYSDWNTNYILLAGDNTTIPARKL